MSDAIDTINAALTQPPGSTQALDEALRYFFSPHYSYYRDRPRLEHPSIQDPTPWLGERMILEHLAGGRWAAAFLRCEIEFLYNSGLLVRGFVDATTDELLAMLARYPTYGIAVFNARTGDDPAKLLAARDQSEDPLLRRALLCAAIASSSLVPDALIERLDRYDAVPGPLVYRAFCAMGEQRASRWVASRLDALPSEPAERVSAVTQLFYTLGAPLDRATNDRLLGAYEESAALGIYRWHHLADLLRFEHGDLDRAAREIASRAAVSETSIHDHWAGVLHVLLAAQAEQGAAIDAWFDAHLDAAVAAAGGGLVHPRFLSILSAIGGARAEAVLDRAWQKYASPELPFTLLLPTLSDAYVQKVADALVAAREDKRLLDALPILPLSAMGSRLVEALQRSLAEVKPKKTWVTRVCKVLTPSDAATLTTWLETRPEPARNKKSPKT